MIENENLKQNNLTVTITQHRYEQLLDIETRVDVVACKGYLASSKGKN